MLQTRIKYKRKSEKRGRLMLSSSINDVACNRVFSFFSERSERNSDSGVPTSSGVLTWAQKTVFQKMEIQDVTAKI